MFDGTNAIIADNRGNIIIFSITEEKVILKYNFYKKIKEIKKKLNIIIDNKVVYVSDNIGYLYALDYLNDKLIWRKIIKFHSD